MFSNNRMIYIMHIDWNWIKQRPHFIAEILSDDLDLEVVYRYSYHRKGLQKQNINNNVKPIYTIPGLDHLYMLRNVNRKIFDFLISQEIKKRKANLILCSYPFHISAIPSDYTGNVIYDCMDNYIAFFNNEDVKNLIFQNEKKLIERADIVFVSSQRLLYELQNRYRNKISNKAFIVRNAYGGHVLPIDNLKENSNSQEMINAVMNESTENVFRIAYFGTISKWFNFEYLLKSLDDVDNLEYILIGPIDDINIPKHDRIKYLGVVEHNKLYDTIKNYDALMMPFIVNDIVEAVDPVKLYEYINFNKKILCVKYREIERFSRFVYFYTNYESYLVTLKKLMRDQKNKYSLEDRTIFLKENSWKSRVDQIERILEDKINLNMSI